VPGSEPSTSLEAVAAQSAYTTTALLYEDPELPAFASKAIEEYMKWQAFLEDREDNLAQFHFQLYQNELNTIKQLAPRVGRGFKNRCVTLGSGEASTHVDVNPSWAITE
jgi:hypothetical protein